MPYKDPEKKRANARLRSARYRANHPERVKAIQAANRIDHLEERRAAGRARHAKYRQDPEYRAKNRARAIAWYWAHRAKS